VARPKRRLAPLEERDERIRTFESVLRGQPWVPISAAAQEYALAVREQALFQAFSAGLEGRTYMTCEPARILGWRMGYALRKEVLPVGDLPDPLEAFRRLWDSGALPEP